MTLQQLSTTALPFVGQFIAFAPITGAAGNNKIPRIVRAAARDGDYVVNLKLLFDWATAPVALATLRFVDSLYIVKIMLAALGPPRTIILTVDTILVFMCLPILSVAFGDFTPVTFRITAIDFITSNAILFLPEPVIFGYPLLIARSVKFIPSPYFVRIAHSVCPHTILYLLLIIGVVVAMFATFATFTRLTDTFVFRPLKIFAGKGKFTSTLCAASYWGFHSVSLSLSRRIIASGSASDYFSGATLDAIFIIPQGIQ